jgi:hypothetical protein
MCARLRAVLVIQQAELMRRVTLLYVAFSVYATYISMSHKHHYFLKRLLIIKYVLVALRLL